MKPLEIRLPEIIQEYLTKTEISQVDLAEKADINPSVLSRIIHSRPKRVDIETVNKLRAVIKFTAGELLGEE